MKIIPHKNKSLKEVPNTGLASLVMQFIVCLMNPYGIRIVHSLDLQPWIRFLQAQILLVLCKSTFQNPIRSIP